MPPGQLLPADPTHYFRATRSASVSCTAGATTTLSLANNMTVAEARWYQWDAVNKGCLVQQDGLYHVQLALHVVSGPSAGPWRLQLDQTMQFGATAFGFGYVPKWEGAFPLEAGATLQLDAVVALRAYTLIKPGGLFNGSNGYAATPAAVVIDVVDLYVEKYA